MHENEKFALLALSLIKRVGNKSIKNLISYIGSAELVLKEKSSNLQKVPGIGQDLIHHLGLDKSDIFKRAEKIISECAQKNISIIAYTEKDYPYKLKHIYDSPPVIYTRGNGDLNRKRQLAIVGTRNATAYGLEQTEKIIAGLKPYDVQIISGLAYGIDHCAHAHALKHNIPTWGVLACGLDMIYPAVHKKMALEMLESGGLISEQVPGTKPDAFYFPARNRIIAGMSDFTLVIEAAAKGGALITAELANEYDREVGAVPGKVDDEYSQGCLQLIKKNKAHLITSADDIAKLLNWDVIDEQASRLLDQKLNWSDLPADEEAIVQVLFHHKKGLDIDNLSWKSQVPINKTASLLLSLEFKGLVKSLPGKKFKLKN